MALTLLVTVGTLLFNFLIIYGIMSFKDLESVTLKTFHKENPKNKTKWKINSRNFPSS